MINSNPITPTATTTAAVINSTISFVAPPAGQPSRPNTVVMARVDSTTSAVSQPTISNQDTKAGSLLPCTPKAARLSTMVGAEPRLPASATSPQAKNDKTMPT